MHCLERRHADACTPVSVRVCAECVLSDSLSMAPSSVPLSLSYFLPPPSVLTPSNSSSSAMQEDGLKLVLLALEDGSALSRKVLVLFVVQKLEARFPQASKTSIGHVVQLLYRASCFKVLWNEHTHTHHGEVKAQFKCQEP